MTSSDSDIRALLDTRVEACQDKDIDRLMSLYSPGIVYYDVVPPLQFVGTEEVRRNFVRWFDEYDGPISLETHDLTIATDADVAFVNMLHLDSGTRKNGLPISIWVRSTVCCRRSGGGTWSITHEHISVPFNPENLQAWFPPEA
ncbi:YybH family protein [Nonomuraea rubra]|uniref:YybH family protein n=1 Tax=Nonomuraea rubra TaxID=46180 RepID=UPI003400ADA8